MPDELTDLTKLTTGEKLWLVRRRYEHTQSDTAKSFGVSRWTYAKYEHDTLPYPRFDGANIVPELKEYLLVARRRLDWSLGMLCLALGISRVTLFKYEREGNAKLISFYVKKGFTFGERSGTVIQVDRKEPVGSRRRDAQSGTVKRNEYPEIK